MDYVGDHVMTLANSIIGVSILAMPYCFKQCGVILSILILLISSIISRLACHFLLKSAILSRRKTFEFLAFHIFGTLGKFSIEIGMIGFLLGTCVAFFVVMGDLAPDIILEISGQEHNIQYDTLRNSVLVALGLFCVLPMGLLKNVDSLNGVSKATIGFYCCLVLKVIFDASPVIVTGHWMTEVELWRPAGILQCLPIFSMALFCQTQLFEIYQALPNASLDKMNYLIRVAVNICTCVYILVGSFGYIAFHRKPFTGNVLLNFEPSIMTNMMKMGFVLSLACSFPLVIFPCRASLHSLLYKGGYTNLHDSTSNYIPEGKFKLLTLAIVLVSLVIGILIPNIELVLGLVGSTIGVMICVIFPVTCFICISPKNTNERILAQMMFCIGIVVMVMGTYENMYAFEEANVNPNVVKLEALPPPQHTSDKAIDLGKVGIQVPVLDSVVDVVKNPVDVDQNKMADKMDVPITVKPSAQPLNTDPNKNPDQLEKSPDSVIIKEARREPLEPVEPPPDNLDKITTLKPVNVVKVDDTVPENPKIEPEKIKINDNVKVDTNVQNTNEKQGPVVEPVVPRDDEVHPKEKQKDDVPKAAEKRIPIAIESVDKMQESPPRSNKKAGEEVDIEAIKKEDSELKEQEKEKDKGVDDRNKLLIDTIQKQNEFQQQFVEHQKKFIEVIERHQEVEQNHLKRHNIEEEQVKAVKEIESIALQAIKKISGDQKPIKNESSDLKNKIDSMEPLPIVLAKLNNVTLKSGVNKTDDVKAAPAPSSIKKREVVITKDDVESIKVAMKQVCDDLKLKELNNKKRDNENGTTEKPIIKMLCQLSDPDLRLHVDNVLSSFKSEKLVGDNPKTKQVSGGVNLSQDLSGKENGV